MWLKRITLVGFAKHDDRSFTFEPGLNLVRGPNEAGKTTLQAAIMFALLGNPDHSTLERTKHVDDHITWGRDNAFKIVLDFRDGEGTEYRLQKDWGTGSARLTNSQSSESLEDIGKIEKHISQQLGYGSLKLLQSTILVEQDSLDDISAGRTEIGDQLQSIVTGSGEDEARVSAVLHDLEKKIADLERGWRTSAPKNPGPIKGKLDEIGEIERRLSEIRPQVERAQEAKEQLVALDARLQEIATKLGPMKALKERCDTYYELIEEKKHVKEEEQKLEDRIRRIQESQQELEKAQKALKAYAGFETLDAQAEQRLSELNQQRKLLQEEIKRQSAAVAQTEPETPTGADSRSKWWIALASGGLVVAILLLVTGVILSMTRSPIIGIIVGVLGILLGLISLVGLLVGLRRRRVTESKRDAADRTDERQKQQERLKQVTAQLDEALSHLEVENWDEFARKLSAYKSLRQECDQADFRLQTRLDNETLDDLIERRKRVSRNRRDVEEKLEAPEFRRAAEVDSLRYEKLKADIADLERELEDKEEARIQHRTRIDDADYTIEDIHHLQERKAAAERSLAHLKKWLDIYKLTHEVMAEAKEQTLNVAGAELAPRISAHLSHITGGRYDRVRADDNLNLTVFSSEKEDWVSPESDGELSRGTIDQLYLATRLALLDLLYPDTKPPLLLDDPFVKFDPERRSQALALCHKIAQEHQVLLFTCQEEKEYDSIANQIIAL